MVVLPLFKTHSMKQKQEKIEVSLERVDHESCQFFVYKADSNRTSFRSQVYSTRKSAKRGAVRYAARNKYKITRWLL